MTTATPTDTMKLDNVLRGLKANRALLVPLCAIFVGGIRLQQQVAQLEVSVKDMQEKGHLEHELRIRAVEAAVLQLKADKGEKAVITELAGSVRDMTNAMRLDHDVLVRLVTLTEQRSKDKP